MVLDRPLQRDGGAHRARTEEVVAAPLAVGVPVFTGLLAGHGGVSDSRKSVELRQNTDNRPTAPEGGDEGGWHSRHTSLHREALGLQQVGQEVSRLILQECNLGEVPEGHGHPVDLRCQCFDVGEGGLLLGRELLCRQRWRDRKKHA